MAINSPLLDQSIDGAKGVLFVVSGGDDLTLYEVDEAAEIIGKAADPDANIIFGMTFDPTLDQTVRITVVATGFDARLQTRTVEPQATFQQPGRPIPQSQPVGDRPRTLPSLPTIDAGGQDIDIPPFLRRQGLR
jgi:cell division protein FtsZ